MITDYMIIIEKDAQKFVDRVCKKIIEGWQPHGNPFVIQKAVQLDGALSDVAGQAMIKDDLNLKQELFLMKQSLARIDDTLDEIKIKIS